MVCLRPGKTEGLFYGTKPVTLFPNHFNFWKPESTVATTRKAPRQWSSTKSGDEDGGAVRLDWLKLYGVLYCFMPGVRDLLAHLPLPRQALTHCLDLEMSSRTSFSVVASKQNTHTHITILIWKKKNNFSISAPSWNTISLTWLSCWSSDRDC